ncbi:MAG: NAD(P)/FAD-dependent oxidoreductase, partial [Actinomycetota bacterium]|nr:NAD(P)/FAD-dependent oxidoreductase [Actinomycetota bacterium]
MADRFDAVLLGMGPGGEVAASRLIAGGKRVAVVEKELIGGECAYWACIPSKALLRPPEVRGEAKRAFGTGTPTLELGEIFDYRDWMIRNLDDSGQVEGYEKKGATVIKGEGRISGPGNVEVNGETLQAKHIIVATGSAPNIPPVEGLDDVTVWTNREVTTSREVPERTVIIGGGPNGIEAAQWLSRFGSDVTIVQSPDRLMNREDPKVGDLIRDALEEEGIRVLTGRKAVRARKDAGGAVVDLDDGTEVVTDVVVVAVGRKPRTEEIGLESVGIGPNGKGLPIDDRCRLAEGVWALGDVTGVALFTHVAMYQGRVVADNILGKERRADYRGIPRVVFSDPEIAACGLTEETAREEGVDVAATTLDATRAIARPWTYEENPRG